MKSRILFLLSLIFFLSLSACGEKDKPTPEPPPKESIPDSIAKGEMHYIVLHTKKEQGETLNLRIDAAEVDRADVWIDLNGNGKKDKEETKIFFDEIKSYSFRSKRIVVYGKITKLDCSENKIYALNLSKCVSLEELYCSRNHLLSSLDLNQSVNLSLLSCFYTSLDSLDLSRCVNLVTLGCGSESLVNLNLSQSVLLESLSCSDASSLTNLDISKSVNLRTLHCSNSSLVSLDLSGCPNLVKLNCSDDARLESLIIKNNSRLRELFLQKSGLNKTQLEGVVAALPTCTKENRGAIYLSAWQSSADIEAVARAKWWVVLVWA